MIKFLLRVCLIAIILMGLPYISFCQNSANYSFLTNSTGSLVLDKNGNAIDMATGTTQIYGPNVDFPYTAVLQNIGFTFYFMGQPYTNFSVNPDGQLRFGSNLMIGQQQGFALNEPKLFPMNYGGKTTANGKVHFKVQGSTPNSVLILEWKNILIPESGTSNTTASTFQIRLYENNGTIEYVYGTMFNSFSGSISYILGFASSNVSGTIGQVTNIVTSPTFNSTSSISVYNAFPANGAMTNLNSSADGSRRVFTFTPPVANAPSNLVLSSLATTTTLSWTDLANNEIGYNIYRSTDGINYSLVSTLPANTTTSAQSGLNQATLYYWRFSAFTEGGNSNFISGNSTTGTCSISGVKTIPGTYSSITAAVAALRGSGIAGPVILELQPSYTGSGETYPITLNQIPCASSLNTITIRPAIGVSNAVITSTNSVSTMDINSGNYWIIDGRAGGTGTNSNLTISNTGINTGSSAFRFVNNGSNNVVKYVSFLGTGSSATSGVISFIGSPTESNSSNIVDNCSIDGNANAFSSPTSGVSRNGIFSLGNSLAQNSNNTVSNCKIFNWFLSSASSTSSGILLSSGNTDWTITGNSFYQTAPRVSASGTNPLIAINISNPTTGNNFNITNNFIGGRAPLCGGSAWTQSGFDAQFTGINLSVGLTSPSSVQGNKIANLNISTYYFEPFYGINVDDGMVNIGNLTGNEIGSSFGTGSIVILSGNTSSSGGTSRGIAYFPTTYTVTNISNNKIGSITCSGNFSLALHNFFGIHVGTSTATITGNLIGGENTPNSIYLSNTASSSFNQQVAGILSITYSGYTTISNNIVANIRNAFAPTSATFGSIRGIGVLGLSIVSGNIVRDLYATSNAIGTGNNASIVGIQYLVTGSSGLPRITGNTIYSLLNSNVSGAVSVNGIYYQGPASTGTIEKNLIHSLSVRSSAATVNGIFSAGGIGLYQNNMIRLGIDTFGADLTIPCTINGILDSLDRSNYFHNTVFIGGNNVGISSNNTFAFKSYVTTSNRDFRNNIFINYRSNTNSGGKHYAIQVGGTGINPAGLVLTNNVYESSGNGGVFGRYNSADVADLAAWRAAIGGDANSKDYSPMLEDPAAGFPDLHLSVGPPFGPASSAEGNGTNVSISDDFDGEIRSNLSPIDIGADAGNYAKPIYLGNYPDTNVLENGNIVLWSDSFPAGISRLIATASSDFTGVLSADPLTGVITVTNAMPIGVYQISVWANGSLIRTFSLAVEKVPCNPAAFINASSVNTGTSPFAIVTGDFNNDGKQDIATASGNAVNIRLGNGSGNFSVSTNINLSSNPQAIAVGDINGDGNIDIVTGNSGSPYITSLFGNGKGAFGISNTTGGDPNSGSIILADYNNDGKLDILSVSTSFLDVYLNNGFGVFSLSGLISSGGLVYSGMAVSDFNRDGNIDLAILNRGTSTVLIKLGNGAGNFTGSTSFSVGSTPYYIATGDFNHDNKTDIATANSAAGSVSVRLGNGLGGFSGTTDELVGTSPYGILINDMNGDGHQDIVCAANVSSRITIRFGNGTGGFNGSSYVNVNSGPRSICIGDFNGDSLPDIAATHATSNIFTVRLGVVNEISVQHNGNTIADGSTLIASSIGTDFGNANLSTHTAKTYKIKNTNNNVLVLSSYSMTGLNASEFVISGLPGYDSLYGGDSLAFTITFTPAATGIRNATVHIVSDDCDEADYDFLIQGTGIFNCNVSINDNNVCTTDACNSITGISHVFVNPDDGNPCTIDGCDPVSGVYHNPVSEICGNNMDDNCNGLIDENCREILNLTTFIEGFYLGNGTMRPTVDPVYYPFLCDTMIVSLHRSSSPYSLEFADTATIDIHGEGRFDFPYAVLGNSYYIVTHHRNALETWSGAPIFFNDTVINYSFIDSLPQAYGNNLFDLGDGNFALWSGDIGNDNINSYGQQDGFIKYNDYFYLEQALLVTSLGYNPADLTGDGIVESLDYMYMENSFAYLISTIRP